MGKPKVWVRRRKGKGRKLRSIIVVWEKLPEVPREQKSFKRDAEAAEEFAAKKRLELRAAGLLTSVDRNLTVKQYGERWLAELQKVSRVAGRGLKHSTLRSYRIQCETHVYPTLGDYRMRDVNQQHVEAFLTERLSTGLATGSVHTIYSVLRRMFQRARHQGVIAANCVLGVWRELPGISATVVDGHEEKRRKAMDYDQLGAFVAATETAVVPHAHRLLWYTVAKSGARFGEALGLKVSDVATATRELHIRRNLAPEDKERTVEERTGTTKTKRSRVFEMGRDLAAALDAYLIWRREEGLRRGWTAEQDWLFPAENGGPIDRDAADYSFDKIRKAAGLARKFTPHSLRHTYASQCLMRNAPLLWVAKQLGHSPEMCLRSYAWALPSGDNRWADVLDGVEPKRAAATGTDGSGAPENSEPLVTISEEEKAALRGETVDSTQTGNGGQSEIHSFCGTSDVPNKGDSGCRPDKN